MANDFPKALRDLVTTTWQRKSVSQVRGWVRRQAASQNVSFWLQLAESHGPNAVCCIQQLAGILQYFILVDLRLVYAIETHWRIFFSRKKLLALDEIVRIEPAWSSKAEAESLNDLISFGKP